MKALVYTQPHTLAYRDEAAAEAAPGDVWVRVEAAGICGSDMHAYYGHDPRRVPPLVLGHEVAGTVESGPDAGRRVALNPLITCGTCEYCRRGRTNLCPNRTMIGMTRPGGMAQRVSIPAANVLLVPALPAVAAALAEPVACAVHALRLAEKMADSAADQRTALVIGGGAIGLVTALALRAHGVGRITVSETNPLRRQVAADLAGIDVVDPSSVQGDNRYDVVYDCVGAAATRSAALRAVRPGGVVVLVGLQAADGPFDGRRATLAEIAVLGSYTYTAADFATAITLLEDGAFGALTWVEQRPLADGARAFADLAAGKVAAAKIVLVPSAPEE